MPKIPYLRHLGSEGGVLPDSYNLICSFPSVSMQHEIDLQVLFFGANLPMIIDSHRPKPVAVSSFHASIHSVLPNVRGQ